MKALSLWIVLFFLPVTIVAEDMVGTVVGVSDGDTITVLIEDGGKKRTVKVRLSGIDTPEKRQAYGTKAKAALSQKVFNKRVQVRTETTDRYGRTIGDVYIDSVWINHEMVIEGWAWHYKAYSKDNRLAAAEQGARAARRGLWADAAAVPPWEFRRGARTNKTGTKEPATGGVHWLNTSSETRHNEGCKYFKKTKRGRMCGPGEGKACGLCGG